MTVPASQPLDRIKPWLDATQTVLTIVGIFAAAIWFFQQRSEKPMVKVEHLCSQRALDGVSGTALVAVEVRVTNVGKVRVPLDAGDVEITQINPQPGADLLEAKLKTLDLEPGEVDQAYFRVYRIPYAVKTIQVHTLLEVPDSGRIWWKPWTWLNRTPLYWNLLSSYDLKSTQAVNTVSEASN